MQVAEKRGRSLNLGAEINPVAERFHRTGLLRMESDLRWRWWRRCDFAPWIGLIGLPRQAKKSHNPIGPMNQNERTIA